MGKRSRCVISICDNDMRCPELPENHSNEDRDIITHKLPKDEAIRAPSINTIF